MAHIIQQSNRNEANIIWIKSTEDFLIYPLEEKNIY
jgi:hypothetical protein